MFWTWINYRSLNVTFLAENGRKTEKNQVVQYHKFSQYKSQLCRGMTVQVFLDG